MLCSTRFRSVLTFCFASAIALGLTGCGKQPNGKDGKDIKVEEPPEETFGAAARALRQSGDIAQYREALNLVNSSLKPDAKGIHEVASPELLTALFGMEADELAYLRGPSFRPPDAYYLESCYLFRDAARSLEVSGLSHTQQVQHALDWVLRHVIHHEQADTDLPASFIVKQGHGGIRDRGLVMLELLRQMGLEGCLVYVDGTDKPDILLGVLFESKEKDKEERRPELALFNLRLGTLLPGHDAKHALTFSEAVKDPALLKPLGLGGEAKARLTPRLAPPLGSLAPRMDWLEGRLADHQRITLAQDIVPLKAAVEKAAGMEVAPWPKEETAPLHFLLRLLPKDKEEEGRDTTRRRLPLALSREFPGPEIAQRLFEMDVLSGLVDAAQARLFAKAGELFTRFYLQPRDMLLHGKADDALTRMNRLISAFDDLDRGVKDAKFEAQVDQWRKRVNDAYTAKARGEKDVDRRLAEIWEGDRFLQSLLDVGTGALAAPGKKEMLSYILLYACRQPIGSRVSFLVANCAQDKAERRDAAAVAKKGGKSKLVRDAWTSARGNWKSYCERYPVDIEELPIRLKQLERVPPEARIVPLERLFLDLHHSLAARLLLAQAEYLRDEKDIGLAQRERLRADLQKLKTDPVLKGYLASVRKDAKGDLERRLELLARDWAPGGPLDTWLAMLDADPFSRESK
ncbi:MAG: hypothetical protein U0793_28290 [Gemmataceae bacterium]